MNEIYLLLSSPRSDFCHLIINPSFPYRDHLLEDAFRQLELKIEDLKKPLRISYVGCGEQGLDMGGLQKEFFQVVTAALFTPDDQNGEEKITRLS